MKRKIIQVFSDHDESGDDQICKKGEGALVRRISDENKIARTRIEIIEKKRVYTESKSVTHDISGDRLPLHTTPRSTDQMITGTMTEERYNQGPVPLGDNLKESHISEVILRKELSTFQEKIKSLETQLIKKEHRAEVDRSTISTLGKTNGCIMSKNKRLNDELMEAHIRESSLLEELFTSQRKFKYLEKRSCDEQYKAVVLEVNAKLDECYKRERSLQESLSSCLNSMDKKLSEEQKRNQIHMVLVSKLKKSNSELKKSCMREVALRKKISTCLNSIEEQVSKEKHRSGCYISMISTLSESNATLTAANKNFQEERETHNQSMAAAAVLLLKRG